jgi:Raf kinase inhibitor-like YbhB/YbcL family protein
VAFRLESTAFKNGGSIPKKYACDGEDVSPPLTWADPPSGTRSFALICDDPDAPILTWIHWVIYGIPTERRDLKERMSTQEVLDDGILQGANSWRRPGYGGPCPPGGTTHRYIFRLYALDVKLDLRPGRRKKDLEIAMTGHILAETQLMGLYARA